MKLDTCNIMAVCVCSCNPANLINPLLQILANFNSANIKFKAEVIVDLAEEGTLNKVRDVNDILMIFRCNSISRLGAWDLFRVEIWPFSEILSFYLFMRSWEIVEHCYGFENKSIVRCLYYTIRSCFNSISWHKT